MSATTLDAHVERTPGVLGGKPRIAGHRIGVHHVADWHLRQSMSVEYIAEHWELSRASVHAALAYYFDHREEIDARTAANEASAEEILSKLPPSRLDERVQQKNAEKIGG